MPDSETQEIVDGLRKRAEGKAGAVAHGVGDRRDELIAEAALLADAANTIEELERERDKCRAGLTEFADPAIRETVAAYSKEKLARKDAEQRIKELEGALGGVERIAAQYEYEAKTDPGWADFRAVAKQLRSALSPAPQEGE